MERISFYLSKILKIGLNPPALRKCTIDKKSKVCSGSELTEVKMGKYSYIGNKCFVVKTSIGNFCSIADKCCIGGANHPIDRVSSSPVFHEGKNILKTNFSNFKKITTPQTIIGNDVWIGMGCYIKAGVKIGDGAVLGMGSVLTKDIPPYEIWAGNPAKKIRDRFEKDIVEKLSNIQWWNYDDMTIKEKANLFENIEEFIKSELGEDK